MLLHKGHWSRQLCQSVPGRVPQDPEGLRHESDQEVDGERRRRHRLGADREARLRAGHQPPLSRRPPLLLPDRVAPLLRHRVPVRWRPHVPHAAQAQAPRGPLPLLQRRNRPRTRLPPLERHYYFYHCYYLLQICT